MRGHGTRGQGWWLGALWVLVGATARAGDAETRAFTIFVDGKPAGECRLTYAVGEDGSETRSGSADVRVKHLLKTYRYHFDGSEVWKGGRLQRLRSTTDDDGKTYSVDAVTGPTGLRVTANGRISSMRAEAWPTTYWRLPAAELREQPLTLLDTDKIGRAHV